MNLLPMNRAGKPGGKAPSEPDAGNQNLVAGFQRVYFFCGEWKT